MKANVKAASDRELVLSRTFSAPRALVWRAMTDPAHVAHWWGPNGFTTTTEEMDFRVGGAWKHIMHGPDGTDYPNYSVFREIAEQERIVYTHHGDGRNGAGPSADFWATWTFEALDQNSTRVTTCMRFNSPAELELVIREYGADEGAKQMLARLADHLSHMHVFTMSRLLNASRELVWRAWTNEDQLKLWFGPTGCTIPTCKLDLRPGGIFHYCMKTPDGSEMWGKWTFREIDPPHRLVLINSFSDVDGGITRHPLSATWPLETLSTMTLTEQEGKTLLTLEWEPYNATAEEIATFDGARDGMKQGWNGTFMQLEAYLAAARIAGS